MPDRFRSLAYLPANVALLDANGVIVEVNSAWRQFAAENSLRTSEHGLGTNYLDLASRCLGPQHRLTLDLRALLAGRNALVTWAYPCHSPEKRAWFNLIGVPLNDHAAQAALIHLDITSLMPLGNAVDGPTAETSRAALVPETHGVDAFGPAQLAVLGGLVPPSGVPILEPSDIRSLTDRQRQVLMLVGRGLNNHEIAAALSISLSSVKAHTNAVVKQLKLSNRNHLALAAAEFLRGDRSL